MGKTTFLNNVFDEDRSNGQVDFSSTAVIINEFGEVSLDHLLVEKGADGVIELSSGCLCCAVRGEFIDTLERLLARSDEEGRKLTSIIVETTGIADPAPVLHAILAHPLLSRRLTLGNVVTLVDVTNGLETLETYPEAQRQVGLADYVVLTKADMLDDKPDDELLAIVRNLSSAQLISSEDAMPVFALEDGGGVKSLSSLDLKTAPESRHTKSVHSFAIVDDEALSFADVCSFLAALTAHFGARLLRVKGLVRVKEEDDRPFLVQGVQSAYDRCGQLDCWPDDNRQTRLVFISDGVNDAEIRSLYNGFSNKIGIDQPDRVALTENPLAIPGV